MTRITGINDPLNGLTQEVATPLVKVPAPPTDKSSAIAKHLEKHFKVKPARGATDKGRKFHYTSTTPTRAAKIGQHLLENGWEHKPLENYAGKHDVYTHPHGAKIFVEAPSPDWDKGSRRISIYHSNPVKAPWNGKLGKGYTDVHDQYGKLHKAGKKDEAELLRYNHLAPLERQSERLSDSAYNGGGKVAEYKKARAKLWTEQERFNNARSAHLYGEKPKAIKISPQNYNLDFE